MKLYCPKHPEESLRTLVYHQLNKDKKKKGIRQGQMIQTQWVYCAKCDKPYKPKVVF